MLYEDRTVISDKYMDEISIDGQIPGMVTNFLSSIGGKLGEKLALYTLKEAGLGSVAEFLGLVPMSDIIIESMTALFDQAFEKLNAMDEKLDKISDQLAKVEKKLNDIQIQLKSWSILVQFGKEYGEIKTFVGSKLKDLAGINKSYDRARTDRAYMEVYNQALSNIYASVYTTTYDSFYMKCLGFADCIRGTNLGGMLAPGMAYYELLTSMETYETSVQIAEPYYMFIQSMYHELALACMLCSGAMKFSYERETNEATKNTIRGHMVGLQKALLAVNRYLFCDTGSTGKLTAEYITARRADHDHIRVHRAFGSYKEGLVKKSEWRDIALRYEIICLQPGGSIHQKVYYDGRDCTHLVEWKPDNPDIADTDPDGVTFAAAPGATRVTVTYREGNRSVTARYIVHVMPMISPERYDLYDITAIKRKEITGAPLIATVLELPSAVVKDYNWSAPDSRCVEIISGTIKFLRYGIAAIIGRKRETRGGSTYYSTITCMVRAKKACDVCYTPYMLMDSVRANRHIELYRDLDFTDFPSYLEIDGRKTLADTYSGNIVGNGFYLINSKQIANISRGRLSNIIFEHLDFSGRSAVVFENHGTLSDLQRRGTLIMDLGMKSFGFTADNYGTIIHCFDDSSIKFEHHSMLALSEAIACQGIAYRNCKGATIKGCGNYMNNQAPLVYENEGIIEGCFTLAASESQNNNPIVASYIAAHSNKDTARITSCFTRIKSADFPASITRPLILSLDHNDKISGASIGGGWNDENMKTDKFAAFLNKMTKQPLWVCVKGDYPRPV